MSLKLVSCHQASSSCQRGRWCNPDATQQLQQPLWTPPAMGRNCPHSRGAALTYWNTKPFTCVSWCPVQLSEEQLADSAFLVMGFFPGDSLSRHQTLEERFFHLDVTLILWGIVKIRSSEGSTESVGSHGSSHHWTWANLKLTLLHVFVRCWHIPDLTWGYVFQHHVALISSNYVFQLFVKSLVLKRDMKINIKDILQGSCRDIDYTF